MHMFSELIKNSLSSSKAETNKRKRIFAFANVFIYLFKHRIICLQRRCVACIFHEMQKETNIFVCEIVLRTLVFFTFLLKREVSARLISPS